MGKVMDYTFIYMSFYLYNQYIDTAISLRYDNNENQIEIETTKDEFCISLEELKKLGERMIEIYEEIKHLKSK